MEVTIEQLKALILDDKKLSLTTNFYHSGALLIGKGRILSLKDANFLSDKLKDKLSIEMVQDELVPTQVRKALLKEIKTILKNDSSYKNIPVVRRKEIEKFLDNIFLDNDYMSYALQHIHHFSKKLFSHSINVAIFSFITDLAWQKRFNHGLIDSLKQENIFLGALLHDIGYLTIDKTLSKARRQDLDYSHPDLKNHPSAGYELLKRDTAKHQYSNDVLRIVLEHEERLDQTGFPMGLSELQMHNNSKIVGLCNEFEHLLSGELTNTPRTFLDISRYLMAKKHLFHKDCINILIEEFRYLNE